MKKRILSILLLCCMVLTLLPTAAFAADGEANTRSSDAGGLCEHHPAHDEACGYTPQTEDAAGTPCGHVCEICESGDGGSIPADSTGTSGAAMPMTLLGAPRPAATQYTYTLHYDANGGSGEPPSQSVTSSELYVWVPISDKIPTRDGYTFMGWANTRTGKPIYGGNGGYTECLVVHGRDMSTTIYAIWEVHDHSWGEWTSNGNGTHTRTCTTDSSHTETGSCSGGKATGTEKAICETCHTAYGELLPLTKTVITTPPTLPAEGYVGDYYRDEDLKGGEAKAEGTDVVVPGSFRFKHNWGGAVGPGENRMEILFTPADTETYATAECIVTVTGLKHTITSVTEEVLPDVPLGTAFEYLGLPFNVDVITNTGDIFYYIPVTWDSSSYDPNKYGEQIITGELHVEESFYAEELAPTSIKAIARITLIGDGAIVPTLEPPTYSRQIYSGDFCQLAFSDGYLSGGKATADGETVNGVFTLNEEQEKYGYWNRGGGLVQVGPLALQVTFTPYDRMRFSTAECTVNVDVIPRKFRQANTSYIDNKKIGTAFEDLGLPNAFYFFAAADEPNHEGSGLNGNVPGIIKWDDSNYDPNSYEEQTIYGEVNRAEFEKYYIVPEGADLRGVIKVTLQADPAETEITQPPVFRWKNGDFTLPDNTMFVNRIFEMGATGGESAILADGVAKVKGTDTVVPGTFSFKEGTPGWFDELGENVVTVVFTPTDQHGYRTAETTIKVDVIKNTFKRCEKPDPITEKKLGTTFAGLNLPEIVVVEAIDGLRVGMEVSWDKSSYDAQSTAWQTIPGTLVFDANDEHKYQQPEPAVTAAIRVKLLGPEDAPAITTTTLPGGTVGTPYHHQLQATGGGFILWELFSGELPDGLTLKQTTGEISGTPTAEGTAQFTVRALNSVGNDKKELSITIAKDAPAEYTVRFNANGGGGTMADVTGVSGSYTLPSCGFTEPEGKQFKGWSTSADGSVISSTTYEVSSDTTFYAIWESKEYSIIVTDGKATIGAGSEISKAAQGTKVTLTANAAPDGKEFDKWVVESGSTTLEDANSETTTFIMPDSEVSVKATYKNAPVTTYSLTTQVNGGHGTISASKTGLTAGSTETITFTPEVGYEIDTVTVNGTATSVSGNTLNVTMNENKTVIVTYKATGGGEHTHSYGSEWKNDADNHWHECSCGDKTDVAAHTASDWIIDTPATATADGTRHKECTVCKRVLETGTIPATGGGEHTHSYGSEWKNDATNHWHECSCGDKTDVAAHSASEWIIDTPATATADGTRHKECTVCKRVLETGTIPATGGGGGGYNPPVTYYTLRFETGGGSGIPSVQGTYNTYIDLTKYVPTWRGHTFIGWYSERSLMNKVSGVYLTKDMTVYACWRVDENPGTGANPFTDVSEKDWFYGDVMFVYENGLMLGTSKTLFSPHGTVTRGMMATILWRMEGSPAPKGKNSFTDVEAGKWYADAITWTAENGIFAGYGKDKFGPDDPITREQLAAIFYRYADYKGYDLTVKGNLDKFKDADKITDYAKTAMQWAVGSGLVKGKSGNLLDPQGTATRAEIAAMLHRFIEKCKLVQGKAPGGLMGWIDPKRLQIPKTGDSSVLKRNETS